MYYNNIVVIRSGHIFFLLGYVVFLLEKCKIYFCMQNKGIGDTYVTICSGNANKVGIQTTFFFTVQPVAIWIRSKNTKKPSDKIAVVVMNAVPVCVPGMSKKIKYPVKTNQNEPFGHLRFQ